jgi:hypothetical protein
MFYGFGVFFLNVTESDKRVEDGNVATVVFMTTG